MKQSNARGKDSMKIKVKCPKCQYEFEIEIRDEHIRRAFTELLMLGLGKSPNEIAIATLQSLLK